MRILESAPDRYDLGIRLITLGRLDPAYDRLASHLLPGQRVLDLGCGTGALSLRGAGRGARVKGIDVNAAMLEIAARRARDAGLADRLELAEMGVAELDAEQPASYDAVMSGLCFSELSDDELTYTLAQVARILKPGGLLLVADEVRPMSRAARAAHSLLRAPLAALTYIITQQTTRSVADLPDRVRSVGLAIESQRTSLGGSLLELVASKPGSPAR